jgi:hypothetical protein
MECSLGTWYLLAIRSTDFVFPVDDQGAGESVQHVEAYVGLCAHVDRHVTLWVDDTMPTIQPGTPLYSPDIVCKCVTTDQGTIIKDLDIDDGGCFHCWGGGDGLTLHPMTPWVLTEVCGLQR